MPLDGSIRNGTDRRVITLPAELRHIRMLVPRLRTMDQAEIEALGEEPRHLLYRLCRTSLIRRTVFVDGEIAAMWGCAGPYLAMTGEAWLFTAAAVERVPLAFMKSCRRGCDEMLRTRRTLVSHVWANYEASIRFMALLGFSIGEPERMPNGEWFRRITMGE